MPSRKGRWGFFVALGMLIPRSASAADPCWCQFYPNNRGLLEEFARSPNSIFMFRLQGPENDPINLNGCDAGEHDVIIAVDGAEPYTCIRWGFGGWECGIPDLPDGRHRAEVTCLGTHRQFGEVSFSRSYSFLIDDTPPNVSIITPAEGDILGLTTVTVRGTASDNFRLDRVELTYSVFGSTTPGTRIIPIKTNGAWSTRLTRADYLAPGESTTTNRQFGLRSYALDAVGNYGGAENPFRIFTLDATPPSVSITTPPVISSGGVFVGNTSGTAVDDLAIAGISIKVRDGASGHYWTGSGFTPTPTAVEIDAPTPRPLAFQWNYSGLANLRLNSPSVTSFTADALDAAKNKTSSRHRVKTHWTKVGPTAAGETFKVRITRPAGDPVGQPSAENEIILSGPDGAADFIVEAEIQPNTGDVRAKVENLLRWRFVDRGDGSLTPRGVTLTWDNSWPGEPTSGKGLTAKATLRGYPADNAEFGTRLIVLEVVKNGQIIESTPPQPVEVFFKKADIAAGRTEPNWYFYWSQTNAGTGSHRWQPGLDQSFTEFRDGQWVAIIQEAAGSTVGGTWNMARGIDLFANVVRHELQHVSDLSELWGATTDRDSDRDLDLDFLPDDAEPAIVAGHPYDPTKYATYTDDFRYGPDPHAFLRDSEDLALRRQPAWANGASNDKDWAEPGMQHRTIGDPDD